MEERVSRLEGVAEQMSERLAENHAEHANLRADFVRLETKVDSLGRDLNARIDSLSLDLNARIDSLSLDLNARIDSLSLDLNGRIDPLNTRIDSLHQAIHSLHQMIVRALLIGLVLAAGVIVATLIRPLF